MKYNLLPGDVISYDEKWAAGFGAWDVGGRATVEAVGSDWAVLRDSLNSNAIIYNGDPHDLLKCNKEYIMVYGLYCGLSFYVKILIKDESGNPGKQQYTVFDLHDGCPTIADYQARFHVSDDDIYLMDFEYADRSDLNSKWLTHEDFIRLLNERGRRLTSESNVVD